MRADTATRRYRERHIEKGLSALPDHPGAWRHVIVIPAYRESDSILQTLVELSRQNGEFLAIIVLNRPDSDGDESANALLRAAARALPTAVEGRELYRLSHGSAVLLHDSEAKRGPLPADKGVGLARKIGCDIAWQGIIGGSIASNWIHCTDADARLPVDYFERSKSPEPGTVAATYPFIHLPGDDITCNRATALYELRLHHYVLGLEYAGSPYAHHSLGSCLAMTADAYAKVRGFPQRAAGEDFYLLNKLAKLGDIQRLAGDCIELASRESHRVPFGTGPTVARISRGDLSPAQFYHPLGFVALRALLRAAQAYSSTPHSDLVCALRAEGLTPELSVICGQALGTMGWQSALDHCSRHSDSPAQFMRHFHQWFDAFRTLKFLHALRELALPQLTLDGLESLQPNLWPASTSGMDLADAVRSRWGWTTPDPAHW